MEINKSITKSDFIRYLDCPAYFWFFLRKPEVLTDQELSDFDKELIKNGQEVELWARKLFPSGRLVEARQSAATLQTQQFLNEGIKSIFQATFEAEDLYAMIDILEWDETNGYWVINEVKGTSSQLQKDVTHIYDACFQYVVMKMANYKVGKVNLIELNKDFRKKGPINAKQLLEITDITEQVKNLEEEVVAMIADMKQMLASESEPLPCECIYKSRSNHCPAFKHLYPDVPDYSVHDIVRIGLSKKRLEELIEAGYYSIEEVPPEFKLTPYQRNHVNVTQTNDPIISAIEIKDQLGGLVYPLYFLDYETYPTAVPIYDGCSPYQQVPFQFSLHIQNEPSADLEHHEFIHTDPDTHPIVNLANDLMKKIGSEGSIIVWNRKFEGKCHEDIADLLPEFANTFIGYNDRMYDLMEIFSTQLYLHPDFKGSFSIKKVLPVLAPEMTYNDLAIRDGAMAMHGWKSMMFEIEDQMGKDQMKVNLLNYCKLDTLAMVKVLEALKRL